jgi:hypothetical protein
MTFNTPKASTPTFSSSTSITITNNANETVTYSISDTSTEYGIDVYPSPSTGTLNPYGSTSVSLSVVVSNSLSEGTHSGGRVRVSSGASNYDVIIYVSITHEAELEVTPTSADFGEISKTGSASATVTFREKLGYKSIIVSLSKSTGNNWVSTSSSNSFSVYAGGSTTATFYLNPSGVTRDNCVAGGYSWSYTASGSGGSGSSTIYLTGDICCPALLSSESYKYEKITFNTPKSEYPTFERTIKIRVSNTACEQMSLSKPTVESPSGGVTFSVTNYPTYLNGGGQDYVDVNIAAPYSTAEGSYSGFVNMDAGSAGSSTASISVDIAHGVEFAVSPTTITFGKVEIMSQASKSVKLQEKLGYKSVKNVAISKSSGPEWMTLQPASIYGIPAGESDTIAFNLYFRGEAELGTQYDWSYNISSDAGGATVSLSATAIPINVSKTSSEIDGMTSSGLYKNYAITEQIISNSKNMLSAALSGSDSLTAEGWGYVALVASQSLTLLKSLDNATSYIQKNDYDNASSKIVVAAASSKSIYANSKKIGGSTTKSYANKVSSAADSLSNEMLTKEIAYYEDRARTMKETNYLEAIKAYQNAATAYGLMLNPTKEAEYNTEASSLLLKHDKLIEKANGDRVDAEKVIISVENSKLSKVGGGYALFNPFNFDTVSKSYKQTIDKYNGSIASYVQAGELRMSELASTRLDEIKGEWRAISEGFYIYMEILATIFIVILFRSVKGMAAYMRDSAEERLGDVVIQKV